MNYIGLMSGTSMDAIDAVVISLQPANKLTLLASWRESYPDNVRAELLAVRGATGVDLEHVAALDVRVGELFAGAANQVRTQAGLGAQEVRAIGSHGQTLRHRPDFPHPFSLQIGDPAIIAERTGITTVADFRASDIAAGGQGAPLAAGFHYWLFHDSARERAILNIGGIANISCLPADSNKPVLGFDTGPGNTLLDAWTNKHRSAAYDVDGQWAASGKCQPALLQRLCADPYFSAPAPKSTGFEYFNLRWLEGHLAVAGATLPPQDVQATLAALTAHTIAQALNTALPKVDEVYVCGGGVHNTLLIGLLRAALPGLPVHTTEAIGLAPDWVEAAAFAWLAHQALEGRAGNVPSVTGARHTAILGGIYRYG